MLWAAWASAAEPDLGRLFPEAPLPASAPSSSPAGSALPWAPLAGGAACVGAALWWRRRQAAVALGDEHLRVVGRAALGPSHGVVLVEARDAQGAWTRWLVADGATPALLADLGRVGEAPAFDGELDRAEAVAVSPTPVPDARADAARALVAEMAAAARRGDRSIGPVSASRPGAASRYRVQA